MNTWKRQNLWRPNTLFWMHHDYIQGIEELGHKCVYETLYESYVPSIMNYAAGVWGFHEHSQTQVIQNRIKRFYLRVHTYAPVSATNLEFDWLDTKTLRWLEIVRLPNRIKSMEDHWLPKVVLKWDDSLRANSWADSVKHILDYASIDSDILSDTQVDLEVLTRRPLRLNCNELLLEAQAKTKLHVFHKYTTVVHSVQ